MKEKNLYHILGVSYDANKSAIEVAYRQLALLYHPDRNHNQEAAAVMAEINHAFAVLQNTQRRKEYDRTHVFRTGNAPPPTPVEPVINQTNWKPRTETKQNNHQPYLILQLHNHPYAVQLDTVISVIPPKTIQWTEEKPSWISGVIEHQGNYYPAADLRELLDLSLPENHIAEPFLLCRIQGVDIALQIDKALRTHTLSTSEIKAVPKIDKDLTFSFLNGLFLDGEQVVLILNPEGLLTAAQQNELNDFLTVLALT
ncbi:MAG: chemotaxis protein CheW [Anaerolineaceae bacterium]|nr:chemotaxis protein CheW [Anaerolineaceae bacterium]